MHTLCEDNPCKNKATCDVTINGDTEVVCSCPLGYQGATCEDRIDVEVGSQPERGTRSRDPATHSHWSGAALLRVQLAAAAAGGRGQRAPRHRARDGGHNYLVIYIYNYLSINLSVDIESPISICIHTYYLQVRLDAADGMILWIGIDPTADDYLGLGVEVKIENN